MPRLDPARAGLTNTGRPRRGDPRQHAGRGRRRQSRSVTTTYGACSRPACANIAFIAPLSIAAARREHARSRRRARRPSRAGPGSCRPRRRDRAARGTRRRRRPSVPGTSPGAWTSRSRRVGSPASTSEAPRRVDLGQLPVGDAQPVGVVGLEDPATVGGDADRHHVVAVAVERAQHRPGGHARDRVLAATARRTRRPPGCARSRCHPRARAATGGPGAETGVTARRPDAASPHRARHPRRVRADAPAKAPDAPVNVPVVLSARPSTPAARSPTAGRRTPRGRRSRTVVGAARGRRARSPSPAAWARSPRCSTSCPSAARSWSPDALLLRRRRTAARPRGRRARGRARLVSRQRRRGDGAARATAPPALGRVARPTPRWRSCDLAAAPRPPRGRGVLTVCDNTFADADAAAPDRARRRRRAALAPRSRWPATPTCSSASWSRPTTPTTTGCCVPRTLVGSIPGPFEAWLALRGLRTLALRVEQSQASALQLAIRLSTHPAVTAVRYPGLPDDPGHAVATRQMDGYGAIVAFETVGDAATAEAFCDAHASCHARDEPRRRRDARGAAAALARGAPRHPRDPHPALGRHRGRRGPLGRPRAGARRSRPR